MFTVVYAYSIEISIYNEIFSITYITYTNMNSYHCAHDNNNNNNNNNNNKAFNFGFNVIK